MWSKFIIERQDGSVTREKEHTWPEHAKDEEGKRVRGRREGDKITSIGLEHADGTRKLRLPVQLRNVPRIFQFKIDFMEIAVSAGLVRHMHGGHLIGYLLDQQGDYKALLVDLRNTEFREVQGNIFQRGDIAFALDLQQFAIKLEELE